MRVTHNMLARNVSNNLRQNLFQLDQKSRKLSSGKNFHRPSQDPAGTYKVMRISHTSISRNEQYKRNIGEGITWLTVTEDALDHANEALQRLRELSVHASSGTFTDEDREMILPEVAQIKEHLVGLGNTEVNELYVFGGHKTAQQPYQFENGELVFKGDDGQRHLEITPAQSLPVNISGKEAFGGVELFKDVDKMYEALQNNDAEALGGEIIGALDQQIENLLKHRAEVGARVGRLTSTDDRIEGEQLYLKELRSKLEDIDIAEVITEFMMQENAYQAALSTGARMIYPSLVEYMR